MSVISLPLGDLPELDAPAFVSVPDIAEETEQGFLASLIYLEGEVALYLDDEDVDLLLNQLADRDLAIISGLLEVGVTAVAREQRIRAKAARAADELFS